MQTTGVSGSTGAGIAQAIAGNRNLGQMEFLKLLVTQLTHQDPLNPQEDKEFLAQMAQFTALEGTLNTNKALEQIQAASLIGRTVIADSVQDGLARAIEGKVESVRYSSEGVTIRVGDEDLALKQVRLVKS